MEHKVPLGSFHRENETGGAYHLARKSENFGLGSNSKVIFRKFRSEIEEYLRRYSFFRSEGNGGNFLTIC